MAALIGSLGWAILIGLAVAGTIVWGVYAVLTRPPAEIMLTRADPERD
jgi:hypothetical protein